jgi:hypothetical protein
MRLLNVKTYKLESYENPATTPPYAILSHRWASGEVLFSDIEESLQSADLLQLGTRVEYLEDRVRDLNRQLEGLQPGFFGVDPTIDHANKLKDERHFRRAMVKKGWAKLEGCCAEAIRYGLSHVWIDTCCINKDSSTELSEAINSMYTWYKDAKLCFAYLGDCR